MSDAVYPVQGDREADALALAPGILRRGPQRHVYLADAMASADVSESIASVALNLDERIANGTYLDIIGRLLGEPRAGLGDDEYRLILRGRRFARDSRTSLPDVWATWIALTGADPEDARIGSLGPDDTLTPCIVLDARIDREPSVGYRRRAASVLRDAVEYGVDVSATLYLSDSLRWDSVPGWDVGTWAYPVI